MSRTYYKSSIIVTGVTGLLRAESITRNTVKALRNISYTTFVTPVTGFCVCARVKKNFLDCLILNFNYQNIFLTCEKTARNTCNTCNNHCFYYVFNFFTCNKLDFTCNKTVFTRNNRLKNQQG